MGGVGSNESRCCWTAISGISLSVQVLHREVDQTKTVCRYRFILGIYFEI